MANKSALLILTDDFEEIEAFAPVDILRRAGARVVVASRTDSTEVRGRSGIVTRADCLLGDAAAAGLFDLVIVPGGPGHKALRADARVIGIVEKQAATGRLVGAICAGPTVLKDAGVLKGRNYTGHFSVLTEMPDIDEKSDVVIDGNVITSRGAGTAVAFGLALVEKLFDREKALAVAKSICTDYRGADVPRN
jgi:4-methyl-5(b-hydroxyethyl)-thiazole monophosphate biosynthesis